MERVVHLHTSYYSVHFSVLPTPNPQRGGRGRVRGREGGREGRWKGVEDREGKGRGEERKGGKRRGEELVLSHRETTPTDLVHESATHSCCSQRAFSGHLEEPVLVSRCYLPLVMAV